MQNCCPCRPTLFCLASDFALFVHMTLLVACPALLLLLLPPPSQLLLLIRSALWQWQLTGFSAGCGGNCTSIAVRFVASVCYLQFLFGRQAGSAGRRGSTPFGQDQQKQQQQQRQHHSHHWQHTTGIATATCGTCNCNCHCGCLPLSLALFLSLSVCLLLPLSLPASVVA